MKKSLLDLKKSEFEKIVMEMGEPKFRAQQLFSAIMAGIKIENISTISKALREKLAEIYVSNPVEIYKKIESKDGTKKYAFKLLDGEIIEGVLMSYHHGNTLCVSSQVGCRMGCTFCASGLNGLVRHLKSSEILGQVLAVNLDLGGTAKDRKITNIVMMGSGEPLDNYEEVAKFLKIINCKDSLQISERNISLSTCGLVPKIKKLAEDGFSVTLTISLHAPTDELRQKLMPIAKAYNLSQLIESAKYYFNKTGRRVVFEYSMIKGENDSFECAEKLAKLVSGFPSLVNLIPLNHVEERGLCGTPKKQIYAFLEKLKSYGVSATLRRTMGEDIEGACGQLRNKLLKNSIQN